MDRVSRANISIKSKIYDKFANMNLMKFDLNYIQNKFLDFESKLEHKDYSTDLIFLHFDSVNIILVISTIISVLFQPSSYWLKSLQILVSSSVIYYSSLNIIIQQTNLKIFRGLFELMYFINISMELSNETELTSLSVLFYLFPIIALNVITGLEFFPSAGLIVWNSIVIFSYLNYTEYFIVSRIVS